MTRGRPLSWVQRAARLEIGICLIASEAVGRRDRVVSLVLAVALIGGVVVALSAFRGYDWRGRPIGSGQSAGSSASLVLVGLVGLVSVVAAFTFAAVDGPASGSQPAAAGAGFAPGFELGVIPRSLDAGAPVGGSTRGAYASYVGRLCAAAAPYQRRLVLDAGILGRASLDVPRALAFARVKTADIFDYLSDVVGEEGQLLADERPSSRAPPPASEVGRAGRLRADVTALVGLEESLSSRYHRIALTWYDHQIPITHAPVRSIAAGTAAMAALAGRILLLERQLGARGCAGVDRPAG